MIRSLKESSRKKLLLAFGAHSLTNVVTITDRMLLVPVMLFFWGAEVFGAWTIIRSIPAYLSISEMGFASAAGNLMTASVIEKDFSNARNVYWSTSALINGITVTCLILTATLVLLVPLPSLFNCNRVSAEMFGGCVFLMSIYTMALFRAQLIYSLARSIGRHAAVTYQIELTRLLEIASCVVSMAMGGGLLEASLAFVLVRLGGTVLIQRSLISQISWLQSRTSCDRQLIWRMLKPASGFASVPISQAFQLQGVTLVLATMLTPSMVAAYTSMRVLARLPILVGLTFSRTAWPEMCVAIAKNDLGLLKKLHRRLCYICVVTNLIAVLTLAVTGHALFEFWTSSRLQFEPLTFFLLCVGGAATAFATAAMAILNAGNAHGRLAALWASSSVLSLILCIAFRQAFNDLGITLIILAFDLLICIFVVLASNSYLSGVNYRNGLEA